MKQPSDYCKTHHETLLHKTFQWSLIVLGIKSNFLGSFVIWFYWPLYLHHHSLFNLDEILQLQKYFLFQYFITVFLSPFEFWTYYFLFMEIASHSVHSFTKLTPNQLAGFSLDVTSYKKASRSSPLTSLGYVALLYVFLEMYITYNSPYHSLL